MNEIQMIEGDTPFFPLHSSQQSHSLLSKASIITLALSIFASTLLAHHSPKHWLLTTLSLSLITLCALPRIIHHGNAVMINIALIVNLTFLPSLLLGGLSAASFHLGRAALLLTRAHQWTPMLLYLCFMTGWIGYGALKLKDSLQRAYRFMLLDKGMIVILRDRLHSLPSLKLWQGIALQLAFFFPNQQKLREKFLDHKWPWSLFLTVVSHHSSMTFVEFKKLLTPILKDCENMQRKKTSFSLQQALTHRLNVRLALLTTKKEELPQVIEWLLSYSSLLVPTIFSHEQFLSLFKQSSDSLTTIDLFLQKLLQLAKKQPQLEGRYHKLDVALTRLYRQRRSRSSRLNKTFMSQYEKSKNTFHQLKIAYEKTYRFYSIWKSFSKTWKNIKNLPPTHRQVIKELALHDHLLKKAHFQYLSLLATEQEKSGRKKTLPSLANRLQLIGNLLATDNSSKEDSITTTTYLGSHYQFVAKDYERLYDLLQLRSFDEWEEKMEALGLSTHKDLYQKGILSKKEHLSKEQVLKNFASYLERHLKKTPPPTPRKRRFIFPISSPSSKQVAHFCYHFFNASFLLMPLLVHPTKGVAGFVAGGLLFSLKNLKLPGTKKMTQAVRHVFKRIPLRSKIRFLFSRRLFRYTPTMHREKQRFARSTFFRRTQIIHHQMLTSLFMIYVCSFPMPGLGSFIQGAMLAQEADN